MQTELNLAPLIRTGWWMALGERAAIEGLLSLLRPAVAVEVGTAEGGSLARLAAHSGVVHAFDLEPRVADPPANVVFHRGDNYVLLPCVLAELEQEGANVDFALVDGDHTATGVRRDLEDLLASGAVERSVIVLHDTMNELVRSGIERVRFEDHPKVVYVDLDFVRSYQARRSALTESWGGLGLVVVDATGGYGFDRFRHFRMGFDDEVVVARGRLSSGFDEATPGRTAARAARRLNRLLRTAARRTIDRLRGLG